MGPGLSQKEKLDFAPNKTGDPTNHDPASVFYPIRSLIISHDYLMLFANGGLRVVARLLSRDTNDCCVDLLRGWMAIDPVSGRTCSTNYDKERKLLSQRGVLLVYSVYLLVSVSEMLYVALWLRFYRLFQNSVLVLVFASLLVGLDECAVHQKPVLEERLSTATATRTTLAGSQKSNRFVFVRVKGDGTTTQADNAGWSRGLHIRRSIVDGLFGGGSCQSGEESREQEEHRDERGEGSHDCCC